VADAAGNVAGLEHLEGLEVRVVADGGLLAGDFLVAAGAIALGEELALKPVVVGLGYRAKAVTLPRDVRTAKVRTPRVAVVLNRSALPLVNGKRVPSRNPAEPEVLRSEKALVGNLTGWDGEGAITVEQDLPFRTEILALFASVQANAVD
jgi:hypothetical protein